MQGNGGMWVLVSSTLYLSYFFLLPEEERVPHEPQFLPKTPAHVCGSSLWLQPLPGNLLQRGFSMGCSFPGGTSTCSRVRASTGHRAISSGAWGTSSPFFTDLKCLQDVDFPLTPFTAVEQHFLPFLIYHRSS